MSALSPLAVFSNPCRLVLAPTQPGLLLAYPHGGTPLGYFVRGKHVVEEETFEVLSEARGRRVAGGRGFTKSGFAMVVTQYDAALLEFLYAFTTTSGGGYTGAVNLSSPDVGASQQPGLVPPASSLLVAPEDTSKPALLIYAPRWSQGGRKEIAYALDQGREEACVVFADDDDDGRDYAVGLLENLAAGGSVPAPVPSAQVGTTLSFRTYTSDYAVLAADSAAVFSNAGAPAEVNFTLPSFYALGLTYTFALEAGQNLRVTAAGGQTIQFGSLMSSSGGNIVSNALGDQVQVARTGNSTWLVLSSRGTWTVT